MSKKDESLSILLVGGHPADAFDNAGGTLAHHAASGDRVTVAVMTHGARSHAATLIDRYRTAEQTVVQVDEVDREVHETLDEKRDEVRGACAVMGVKDVRFLEYDDDILLAREDLIRRIADLVQETRPDIVITHHPYDRGGVANTHSECAAMTLAAIDAAGGLLRNSTRRPHRVAQVFFMGVEPACASKDVLAAGMTIWCDVYVDITDVIERKIAALDMMVSQNYQGAYARNGRNPWTAISDCSSAWPMPNRSARCVRRYMTVCRSRLIPGFAPANPPNNGAPGPAC
ncbi:MAG: PIG-L family deacetylase [Candidatus Latescibacteria bacterium]|nr:PIG-L family deacetylase [Candidatus Latescibacterota bacterium]